MTPERFTDWLQGFVEIQQSESITDTQWLIIKDHLKLVFDKKTPDRNDFLKSPTLTPTDWTKVSDLIGKQVDPSYWQWPNTSPVLTC